MLRGLVDTMLANRKLFIFLSGLMSVGELEDLGPATYAELFREAITDLLEPWDPRRRPGVTG